LGPKRLLQREKKVHAYKNLLIGDRQTGKVVYLGQTTPGKVHDKKMADTEQIVYSPGTLLSQDTGFQGYAPVGVSVEQPKKKPRGRELSVAQKWLNGILCSLRVAIEHCLAGVKRCRIVKDVFRNTKQGLADMVMEIACALHNLRREARQTPGNVNLVELAAPPYSR
jgi:hypothetical protein